MLILIPIAFAIQFPECSRYTSVKDIPCRAISSWNNSDNCLVNGTVLNSSSKDTVQVLSWENYTRNCFAWFNVSTIGVYTYTGVEDGIITVRGEEDQMILAITIFLILINGVLFLLPFYTDFTKNEAGNYMVKKLIWIASFLFLWFNTTMLRQLAYNWGLGIDNFLLVYWWFFTLGIWICIFVMTYVMVVGTSKLAKQASIKLRTTGENGY